MSAAQNPSHEFPQWLLTAEKVVVKQGIDAFPAEDGSKLAGISAGTVLTIAGFEHVRIGSGGFECPDCGEPVDGRGTYVWFVETGWARHMLADWLEPYQDGDAPCVLQ